MVVLISYRTEDHLMKYHVDVFTPSHVGLADQTSSVPIVGLIITVIASTPPNPYVVECGQPAKYI